MVLPDETFFTTVGCMDGRVQEPVIQFGKKYFAAQYPDTITRAGLDGIVSAMSDDPDIWDSVKKKLDISLMVHHSKGIIVHGHEDCAGNMVDEETHKDNIRSTMSFMRTLIPRDVPIVGVYVRRNPSDSSGWIAEEVKETLMA